MRNMNIPMMEAEIVTRLQQILIGNHNTVHATYRLRVWPPSMM